MNCPLCNSDAPREDVDTDGDVVTAEYRCNEGHIIQFILPDFLFTLLIIDTDGSELYQLRFNVRKELIAVLNWNTYTELNLEGEGVEPLIDDGFHGTFTCDFCNYLGFNEHKHNTDMGQFCTSHCLKMAVTYAKQEG